MFARKPLNVFLSAALVMIAGGAQAATGPSSSASPYLSAIAPGVNFTSILTTGDSVGGYRMAGIPDGLGAYDNGNGTFTVLMNHEIGNTLGAIRASGAKGSFVSEWVINKSTMQVVSGSDLIHNVYGWNTATQSTGAALTGVALNRFCSADLAKPSAFYNASTGMGSQARIFMNGEEGGSTGYALANVATGADKGNSYVLGKFNLSTNGSGQTGVGAWENLLANPYSGDKTVVIGNNDGGTGIMNNTLSVYVGTKTNSGSEVDRAGLTNGVMKFINVAGHADSNGATNDEILNATTRTTGIASGTAFTLSNTASTTFSRPEDGTWAADGKTFYFVTTDQLDKTDLATGNTQQGGTRLWAAKFNSDFSGGTLDVVVDSATIAGGKGNLKPNMFDNISYNSDGTLTILEDVGAADHNGKVWQYDPATGQLTVQANFDATRFGSVDPVTGVFTAGTHTNDEETSGVIDITDVLGRNDGKKYSLIVAQDHASASTLLANGYMAAGADPTAMVEGGQLMLMSAPVPEAETYAMMLSGLGLVGFAAARRKSVK
jgi:hypothetical protein